MEIEEQTSVLKFNKKNLIVSASAGSGKTYILIKLITKLIAEKKVPIKKLLILTFTKNASIEMKERLLKNLKEIENPSDFILRQIDDLSVSNISTIHSYCEHSLKKYANILKLNENFTLADENLSLKLKGEAFFDCLKKWKKEDEFFDLFQTFGEKKLFELILDIGKMGESVADKKSFFENIINNQIAIFDEAEKIVCDAVHKVVLRAKKRLQSAHIDFDFCVDKLLNTSLLEKAEFLREYEFPRLPSKNLIGEENVALLNEIKKDLKDVFDEIKALSLTKEKEEEEKKAELEKQLIALYLEFLQNYSALKKQKNVLDFSDLEQNMLSLIANELFSDKFEFVFIDEYQDTNFLQERIVKSVAKNSHFVAVGDAKQGIYGFRLASSSIFLKDVKEFTLNDEDEALYLKSNFRTSRKILDFINDIFKDSMTIESAGIDYKKTAMLDGKKDFKDDGSVTVDVVVKDEIEREEPKEIYSVKEASLEGGDFEKELMVVLVRVEEALMSKIYDPEIGDYRKCEYKDIAILSRGRTPFYERLDEFLREKGFLVMSSKKKKLLSSPEIQILLNLLKVALCKNDEVALLSILMSNFVRLDANEIFRLKKKDVLLFEAVKENYAEVFEMISTLKKNGEVFGYRRAFEMLFDATNYYSYINQKGNLRFSVQKFLEEIESSTFNFDLPSLISYFENVDVLDGEISGGENAILLSTIHGTKGLEYPVVILIGAGKSLKKSSSSPIAMDENLGIAVRRYVDGVEEKTVKLLAIKYISQKKQFEEEMFIFYVALTRAKNRLYIIGEYKNPYSINFDTYFDYIFATLSKEEIDKFLSEEHLEKGAVSFNLVTGVDDFTIKKEGEPFGYADEKVEEKLREYLNFSYRFKNEENIAYKNSVTSLTKKYEENEVFLPSNIMPISLDAVEVGNAYHLALKCIDFNEINCEGDLEKYFNLSLKEVENKIDKHLLFKNIQILKPFTKCGDVFKEQEFVMKDTLKNLIKKSVVNDEILVQGVVDLFVINGEKAVLIDYKYSSSNKFNLINRYKTQLILYKNAIEKGLNKKIEKMFLLNLKTTELIEINGD